MNAPAQNQSSLAAVDGEGTLANTHESRETSGTALAAQAKAIVEARYVMAMKRPRSIDVVRERLIKECKRPGFAQVAMYSKPVGGSKITGPSIRFAETALRCMTNIVVDTPAVYDDEEKRIVRVSVTDLESNVSYTRDVTVQKTVERNSKKETDVVMRTRIGSRGQTVYVIEATDDDIQNKVNALVSKAIRTEGLRVIPGDIVDECLGIIVETQKARDAKDPDGEKYKLFDAFGVIGVTVEMVKEYLGHDAATLQPKELADLRGIYLAIKDGESSWRDVMDLVGGESEAAAGTVGQTLTDRIKAKGAGAKPADPAPPAAEAARPTETAAPAAAPSEPAKPKRRF